MGSIENRTVRLSAIVLGFLLVGSAHAAPTVGQLIRGAEFINSEGTVAGTDPISRRHFSQKLGEPPQTLPSELSECFEPMALTDHALFGRSVCGNAEAPKVGIFRIDSRHFQEVDIGQISEVLIRSIRADAVLLQDAYLDSGTASVIDENAEIHAYQFLRSGEKPLGEDVDGFSPTSDQFNAGLSESGNLYLGLYFWGQKDPQESGYRFRNILASGTIEDFSPWWNAEAMPVRSEQPNIAAHVTIAEDEQSQTVLLHNLDSHAETTLELQLDDSERATLIENFTPSASPMLYGRDGYLYTSQSRAIEYDGGYVGSHPVRVDLANGDKLDLSCSLPPQYGKIDKVLGTSSNGYVLASSILDDQPAYSSQQFLLSPSDLTSENYCTNVAVTFSKACTGHLRRNLFFKHLYTPRGAIKNNNCAVTLTFTDAQHQPVVGARVDLAQATYGRSRSKVPVRVQARTDAFGNAKIKLTRALRRPGVCGWNVRLNSPHFQPNGISLRGASPDAWRCKTV